MSVSLERLEKIVEELRGMGYEKHPPERVIKVTTCSDCPVSNNIGPGLDCGLNGKFIASFKGKKINPPGWCELREGSHVLRLVS